MNRNTTAQMLVKRVPRTSTIDKGCSDSRPSVTFGPLLSDKQRFQAEDSKTATSSCYHYLLSMHPRFSFLRRKNNQKGCHGGANLIQRLRSQSSSECWFRTILTIASALIMCCWILKRGFLRSVVTRSPETNNRPFQSVFSPFNDTLHTFASRARLEPPPRRVVLPKYRYYSNDNDFGGLEIRFFRNTERVHQRIIYHDFNEDKGYDELLDEADDDGDMENYYAFDDDEKRNPLTIWDDPDIHLRKKCRRTSWYRELPINCNSIHEFDFLSGVSDGGTTRLGRGYYKEVYSSNLPNNETVVFKHFFWGANFHYDDFEFMRMDAIVNEKLNGNPRIVKSYGFCGTSFIGESMKNGDLEKLAIPSGVGRIRRQLNDKEHLVVGNNLSGTKKLELSLEMAEAVLLLHSFPGGVIVHDDIQLSQFLISPTGQLKLNDFNRAEIMLWNEKDQEYCKYRNDPGEGDWRAPEEYHDDPLDEKIDVWSLGVNMYALLTGLYPFYEVREKDVARLVKKGLTPYIDPRYKERSFAEAQLIKIMTQCWTYDASKRIDIFQLVHLLRAAVKDSKHNENMKRLRRNS